MSEPLGPDIQIAQRARRSVYYTLIVVVIAVTTLLFLAAVSYFRSIEIQEARNRLSLYEKSLSDGLERFQHLPYVLARDAQVIAGAKGFALDQLNVRLRGFAEKAKLEAVYLLDSFGTAIAASNFGTPSSFVGQNYAFRPYYMNAMRGQTGEFFGVGTTTGRPGYFISEPIVDANGRPFAVIVIKLDMSGLERAWVDAGEKIFVANDSGIIVLTSHSEWLYKTLVALTPEQRINIMNKRQFGNQPLDLLDWKKTDPYAAYIGDQRFIHVTSPADRLGWEVHFFQDERRIYERAALAAGVFGIFVVLLLVFAVFLRSERIRQAFAVSQSDRNKLIIANKELRNAQKELSQSSKLAALGQLSASVTHELGQPISALRNYLAAAEISGHITSKATLQNFSGVIDRMDNLTKQLRLFIKPGMEKFERFEIGDVIDGAMALVEHDIIAAGIDIDCTLDARQALVFGNRLRLEQVVVNLIQNSIAAMDDADRKTLIIRAQIHEQEVVVSVSDTGHGIGIKKIDELQEPFHTTRASGTGMGLGLSISAEIVKDHNGHMTAENLPDGGSIFSIYLPQIIASDNP